MRQLALMFALLSLLAACSKQSAEAPPPAPQAAAARPAQPKEPAAEPVAGPDREDPCQVLEVAEVEAVIGALATPPYRSAANNDEPSVRGDMCRYVAGDGHYLELSVSWTGGSNLLQSLGSIDEVKQKAGAQGQGAPGGSVLHKSTDSGASDGSRLRRGQMPKEFLPYDIPFAGEWDDVRVIGCCRINAFLGDALVVLAYAGSKATPAQAVGLVNKALLRLQKPIAAIDGRLGVAPALQRLAARAQHPKACELVPRAVAESILGPLVAEPSGDGPDKCEYRYHTGAGGTGSEETLRLAVQWQYGFTNFRESATITKAVVSSLPGVVGMDNPANAGAEMMAQIRDQTDKGGGSPESLGKAVQSAAGKAQGKQTATAEEKKPADASTAPPVQGPWEEARWSYPVFTAVGKDVLIEVEGGLKPDLGQQFAAKAFEKVR